MNAPRPKPRQILLSKRANIFYLEHARVLQKDERIVWLTDSGEDVEQYFNLPERNTALLPLSRDITPPTLPLIMFMVVPMTPLAAI
jgi:CRISPR-associated protein Cas1